MVLFANYKTFSVAADEKGKKHKAQGGQRVMYTTHHPCWDAKNRYGLADELTFDYEHIRQIIESKIEHSSATKVEKDHFDISDGVGSGPQIYHADEAPETIGNKSDTSINWEGIPQPLVDLMKQNNVVPEQIQKVVAYKGYYPEDMPISQYDPSFIEGVLIGAWNQVMNEIKLPF